MSQEERYDIYDSEMKLMGQASRQEVHAQGLWHQTFHCWVVHPGPHPEKLEEACLLFQKRHERKDTYPGLLDISAAGHLLAGESKEDGVRELEEELGIRVPFKELYACGVIAQEHEVGGGRMDREFNHVFIYLSSQPLEAYSFQLEEISGLFWVRVVDYRALLNRKLESVAAKGVEYAESEGLIKTVTRSVSLEDFAPHTEEYLGRVFEGIERLVGSLNA